MIARGHYVALSTKIGKQWFKFSRQDAGKRLSAHIKYIEHRARGENEERSDRHLFTATDAPEEDNGQAGQRITRQQALEDIMSNAGKKVYFHQFFLSCADDEQSQDGRALVRETMREFERQRNMRLTWYAAEHNNTDHRHWHIVLAGSGEDRDTGERRDVVMSYKDYEFLREQAHELTDHEFEKQLDAHLHEDDAQERDDMRELAAVVAHELENPDDQAKGPGEPKADKEQRPAFDTDPAQQQADDSPLAMRVDWTRWVEHLANQGVKQDQESKKRNRDNDNDNDREDYDR